ncbi:MAG: hypothetical protein ACFB20_05975 [Opitutales bacterium]
MPSLRSGLYNLRDTVDRTDYRLTAFSLLQRTECLLQPGLSTDWVRQLLAADETAPGDAVADVPAPAQVRTSRSIDFRHSSASLWLQLVDPQAGHDGEPVESLARVKVTRVRQNVRGSAFRCQLSLLRTDRTRTLLLVVDHPRHLNQAAVDVARAAAGLLALDLDLSDERVAELLPRDWGKPKRGSARSPSPGGADETLDQEALSGMFEGLGVDPVDEPKPAVDTGIVGEGIEEGSQEELDALMKRMGIYEVDASGQRIESLAMEAVSPAAEVASPESSGEDADAPADTAEASAVETSEAEPGQSEADVEAAEQSAPQAPAAEASDEAEPVVDPDTLADKVAAEVENQSVVEQAAETPTAPEPEATAESPEPASEAATPPEDAGATAKDVS